MEEVESIDETENDKKKREVNSKIKRRNKNY